MSFYKRTQEANFPLVSLYNLPLLLYDFVVIADIQNM